MPQYALPSEDTNNPGSYTTDAGGSTNLYQRIDEGFGSGRGSGSGPDDTDYIQSPSAPSSAVYVTKFSTLEDPASSSGHVFRNRYSKSAAGGAQINMTFQLREGYTNESTLGTLIVQRAFTDVSHTPTTDAYTLSAGEADAITDYSALYNRIITTQV